MSRQGRDIFAYQSAHGPLGELCFSRPKVIWQVWPGDGCKLTRFHLSIDGELVDAQYDPFAKEIWYRPQKPFAIGEHEVSADAEIDDELQLKRSWKFQVSVSAISELPTISDSQLDVAKTVNQIRDALGLPHVEPDAALSAAAEGHAHYMKESGHVDHQESYRVASWFGYSLEDRLFAYGYCGSAAEDIGFLNRKSVTDTVHALFDAPYHRMAFMQPGPIRLGAGVDEGRVALEFEMNQQEGITTSPVDGQSDVPQSWDGFETPCPLRMHGGQATCGYPILLAGFGPLEARVKSGTMTLTGPSGLVDCWLNTPENDDHLGSGLLLIPQKPLIPGTYGVDATVQLASGVKKTVHWSFKVRTP